VFVLGCNLGENFVKKIRRGREGTKREDKERGQQVAYERNLGSKKKVIIEVS
jgi:hypothetical protein